MGGGKCGVRVVDQKEVIQGSNTSELAPTSQSRHLIRKYENTKVQTGDLTV